MTRTTTQNHELVERQAIVDCLYRYTRGVDRHDEALILSAFHDDATDHHRQVRRSPGEFLDWYRERGARPTTQHYLTNIVIELEGSAAHVESYYLTFNRNPDDTARISGGRYVDRLEKRDGEWRIAVRHVLGEWARAGDGADIDLLLGASHRGSRDRTDPSYAHPR
jgi:hypothetical protein